MSAKNGSGNGPLAPHFPRPSDDWSLRRAGGRDSLWLLKSPLWPGELELSNAQLFAPKQIRMEAANQKLTFLPASFDVDWLKDRTSVDAGGPRPRLIREPSLLERLLSSQQDNSAA